MHQEIAMTSSFAEENQQEFTPSFGLLRIFNVKKLE